MLLKHAAERRPAIRCDDGVDHTEVSLREWRGRPHRHAIDWLSDAIEACADCVTGTGDKQHPLLPGALVVGFGRRCDQLLAGLDGTSQSRQPIGPSGAKLCASAANPHVLHGPSPATVGFSVLAGIDQQPSPAY
jgi:hypothetical protein